MRLRELAADLHRVKSAPWPSSVAKVAAREMIDRLADQGAPNLDGAIEFGQPIRLRVDDGDIDGTQRRYASNRVCRDRQRDWPSVLAVPRSDGWRRSTPGSMKSPTTRMRSMKKPARVGSADRQRHARHRTQRVRLHLARRKSEGRSDRLQADDITAKRAGRRASNADACSPVSPVRHTLTTSGCRDEHEIAQPEVAACFLLRQCARRGIGPSGPSRATNIRTAPPLSCSTGAFGRARLCAHGRALSGFGCCSDRRHSSPTIRTATGHHARF